jgi:hypothetical protein
MAYPFIITIFSFAIFFAVNFQNAEQTENKFKKVLLYTLSAANFVGAIATTICLFTY